MNADKWINLGERNVDPASLCRVNRRLSAVDTTTDLSTIRRDDYAFCIIRGLIDEVHVAVCKEIPL